jgi:hypothetical protein
MQEQMFQLWVRDPSSGAYNSGFSAVLEGPLDAAAMQAAMQMVFERQLSLRTRFVTDGEVPAQRIVAVGSCEECLPIERVPHEAGSLCQTAADTFEVAAGVLLMQSYGSSLGCLAVQAGGIL